MKKIMMTLAAVCVAATMNAQVWVGGELGFSTKHVNGSEDNSKKFAIAPEIGYNLDDNFSVAIKLGYSYTSDYMVNDNAVVAGVAIPVSVNAGNANTWFVNPYVRYAFVKAGNFSAFVDGGLNYATTHIQGADNNINSFGVGINPGIAYNVSDKLTLAAHFGKGLYWEHNWVKDSYRTNELGLELLNGVSFSAYYNF